MPKIKDILKYVNSMPISITIGHYFAFDGVSELLKDDKLSSRESWDILRQNHPHFSISQNREEWIKVNESLIKKDGQDGGLIRRARDVVKIVSGLGARSVFSVGVGGAGLEYHIKKINPEIHLTCSEYSLVTVSALKKVFTECDSIELFDMKNDDWCVTLKKVSPNEQVCLLYRIDIDFSNEELRGIFKNMHDAGIENILIILCGRLTLRGLANRFYQRLNWKIHAVHYSFAGYLRTEKTFKSLWSDFYSDSVVDCAGLKSFLLKKV